jgi:transcriptional regulator GlxA family with amidase domain
LARAVEILHRDFAGALRTQSLAKTVGLSVSQFERAFRKTFRTTPRQYLLRIRVEHACRRLAETGATLAEVAQACGFYDQAHFTRVFQEQMGVKPSVYRRQAQQPTVDPAPAEVLEAGAAARRSAKTKRPGRSFPTGDS